MFNTSFETSQFPDLWKIARVTLIFKEDAWANRGNYRPISILPIISRLFEKFVENKQLNNHSILSNSQLGFLCLFSSTCLFKNTNDWYSCLDLGELVGTVFIDLNKHLILWITKSSAISLSSMVYSTGLNPILQIVNNVTGLMMLSYRRGIWNWSATGFMPWLFDFSSYMSIISHLFSKIVMSPCILMVPVCATDLMIWLSWRRLSIMTSRSSTVGYKATNFLWM